MTMEFSVHVFAPTKGEIMDSMRRMVLRPYLLLWPIAYAAVFAFSLIRGGITIYTILGPAVILLLLAGAYEFTGRKNYLPMGYDKAELDYTFTPKGYTLRVGEKSASFRWTEVRIVKTRKNLLLYSDKKNSSILPLRFLTPEQLDTILGWIQS